MPTRWSLISIASLGADRVVRRHPAQSSGLIHHVLRILAALCLLGVAPANAASREEGPLVLAAISMQDAITAAANSWAQAGHPRPRLSFAGSPALARQIKAGGRADLFISADQAWMDDIARGGLIMRGTRADVAANRLVLVSPARAPVALRIGRNMPIARALGPSRLAMADPDSVPAGRYGKAALTSLGVWPSVQNRIARRENVRSALGLVERGETRLGIVYATDASAARAVRIVGVFPAASHPPIRYPIARLSASRHRDAEAFRRFLLSAKGQAILRRYGFTSA